jgi:hypothetical protein
VIRKDVLAPKCESPVPCRTRQAGFPTANRSGRFLDLKFLDAEIRFQTMTAVKVIAAIDSLPPDEQVKVIQHALELARHRQLSADELGDLAERLAASNDPAEIIRLKSAMTRGFYGE